VAIHRLTFNAGAQTIRTVPLDSNGRPVRVASATYAIVDTRYDADDASHEVATGAATVDSVNTTLSAAAGRSTADPHVVTVTSAVGITVGRRYLISYQGQPELVRVVGIDGTTVRLAGAVTLSFPSGSTFQGAEISCSVPSGTTGDDEHLEENCLAVRWTPDGISPYLESIYIERVAPAQLIAPSDILDLDGSLEAYGDVEMTLDQAARQAVDDFLVDLLSAGREDTSVMAGPIGKRALQYLAAWHLIKSVTEPSAVTRAEKYHARYCELRNGLLQGSDKKKTANLTADLTKKGEAVQSRFRSSW
jgi:hypothetical protein